MGLETVPFIDQVTEARPTNGILECFILKSCNFFDYIRYIFQEREAKVANHVIVKDSVKITFRKKRKIQADGDVVKTDYLEASILPKALNVVV
jgi:diacylglycerol kinase family enzyme